jgi:hypothetical protein
MTAYPGTGTLPQIDQYKYNLPAVIAQAENALAHSPATPRVFQRSHLLVLIQAAEPTSKDRVQRAVGTPLIRLCPGSTLRLCLAKAATWTTPDKRSKTLEETMPQPWVVETILELGDWPSVPVLTGIITAPTLRQDGSLLDTPGHDDASGLFYAPGDVTFPAIPPAPTQADARAALQILAEPFQDFPFKEPHHKSAALAAVLTLLVRHAIPGHVPLFGVKAPTAATGKTLLVDTIATIASGRVAPKLSQPTRDEEWNKQLLTCALEGDQLVLIDNCVSTVVSGELCKAITAEVLKGRILGVHRNAEAPQNAVYFATGNNLRFRGDMVRRVMPIDLESPFERPETRTTFTIKTPLPAWTRMHRPALVAAALTILRAYHLAQDKPQVPTVGSFEAWCQMICGPLVWLGQANPLSGVEEVKDEDEDRERLRTLLFAWDAVYPGCENLTLKQIKLDISVHTSPDRTGPPNAYHDLEDALRSFDSSGKPLLNLDSVGLNLKKVVGRIVCGKVLTRGKTRTSSGMPWTVSTQKPCNCVGCVGSLSLRAGNGRMTNNSSSAKEPTPPTFLDKKNVVTSNDPNELLDNVGTKTTYTTSPSVVVSSPYCPGCGQNSTWLLREGREVCYKCGTHKP